MKLVATWLSGIGLSDAIDTFEAAGIVSPSALAELDVSHFEALGVSDPNDRRKLFYLVQRIKLAVGKKTETEQQTMEAQVNALITNTIDSNSKDNASAAPNRSQNVENEENGVQKTGSAVGIAANTNRVGNGDSDDRRTDSDAGDTEPVSVAPAETAPANLRRSRRLASKAQSLSEPATLSSASAGAAPDVAAGGIAQAIARSTSKAADETQQAEPRQETDRRRSPKPKVRPRSPRRLVKPSSAGASKSPRRPRNKSTTTVPPSRVSAASVSVRSASVSPKRPGRRIEASLGTDQSSDSKLPKPAQNTGIQPPRGRRRESRLQNPSRSVRTGKHLSSIPSESMAPQSPLVELPVSKMEQSLVDQDGAGIAPKPHRRRSRSRDSLDSILASSCSESEVSEAENEDDQNKNPTVQSTSTSTNRRLTFHVENSASATATTMQSSGDENSKASSAKRRSLRHPSAGRAGRLSRGPSSSTVTIQGGGSGENESFKSQIADLREEHASEYDMFSADIDKQTHYDMRIRVLVRKRPINQKEMGLTGGIDIIQPLDYGDHGKVLLYQPKTRVDLTRHIETVPFAFDNVFGESSTNVQIYRRSVRGLIPSIFEGQFNSVFAYGQTGSGKTYTMMGSNITGVNAGTAKHDTANLGLYYLAAVDIFKLARKPEYQHFTIAVSLFEIYGGKLYDLLANRKHVKCLENSKGKVCFPGLSEHAVSGPDELMELFERGAKNRSTGTTSRNADSSRSHAVIQLSLRKPEGRRRTVEHGRLTFIDLAGSERGADTSSASRATRLEGAEINTSLLALKEVIRALATGGSMTHIPFRGSRLTQVLKDSFVGKNSRCCMVACISADIGSCDQTLNTLRYADRVKERNAATGALTAGYDVPVKVRLDAFDEDDGEATSAVSIDQLSPTNTVNADRTLDVLLDPYNDDLVPAIGSEVNGVFDDRSRASLASDCNSALLSNLLNGNQYGGRKSPSTPTRSVSSDKESMTPKRIASEALVATHRSVMASMLTMVKHEMTLVNKVDADRDRLDEYVDELESLQKTQLSLITKLQDTLHAYVAHAEGSHGVSKSHEDRRRATVSRKPVGPSKGRVRRHRKTGNGHESDNDSFEDLRD